MYCSLRIYVDKTTDPINTQHILDVFDIVEKTLGNTYDYISYTLFDPDKDCTLTDRQFLYNSTGKKEFLGASITQVAVGKNGDVSAPFVSATCEGNAAQIYSKIRVQIQFPVYTEPYIIRVDYEQNGAEKLTLEKYARLIQTLDVIGFRVNNSFYHVYEKKNEAVTLDGGQVGSWINCYERQNLKNSIKHHKAGCIDRFMGIYCANSIRVDLIDEDTQKMIAAVVGRDNTLIIGDIFSFSLGNIESMMPAYRIRKQKMIRMLQKLLLKFY